jgi:osmotically-inducible protein OsmY
MTQRNRNREQDRMNISRSENQGYNQGQTRNRNYNDPRHGEYYDQTNAGRRQQPQYSQEYRQQNEYDDYTYSDPRNRAEDYRNFRDRNRNQMQQGYEGNNQRYTIGGYGNFDTDLERYNNWQDDRSGHGYSTDDFSTNREWRENAGYMNTPRMSNRPRNIYGGDTSNRGNANQGGVERSWWDRTRDEVSSWFGDDDDERHRRSDDEKRIFRGKGPKNYKRSDERITEDVCDRLSEDYRIDASDIEVKVLDAEVTLTGTVHSREEKRRAEDIIETVSGVANIQNNLKVAQQSPKSFS